MGDLLSASGLWPVKVLAMNDPDMVATREALIEEGRCPS
jgi:hypothetical protein